MSHVSKETVDHLIQLFAENEWLNAEEITIIRSLDTTHIDMEEWLTVVTHYLEKWGKDGVPKIRKYDGWFRRERS